MAGVDAVIYGSVQTYQAYHLGFIAVWWVGLEITMLSTHSGKALIEATGMRYGTDMLVALIMEDISLSSAENLFQLREINLARSEEETCREIVHRIPVSNDLQQRNEEEALMRATSSGPNFVAGNLQSVGTMALAPR